MYNHPDRSLEGRLQFAYSHRLAKLVPLLCLTACLSQTRLFAVARLLSIAPVSGDRQSARTADVLPGHLIVKVTSFAVAGFPIVPIPNLNVAFTETDGAGVVVASVGAVTGADGTASASMTLGNAAGVYLVTVGPVLPSCPPVTCIFPDGLAVFTETAVACASNSPCITSPLDGASPQSQFAAIAGTAGPAATLDILIDSVAVGSVVVDAEGHWEALPYIQIFGGTVILQARDRATGIISNPISIHTAIGPFILPPPIPVSFLPLRHGDILISSNPASLEVPLYGATWTHSAIFAGGDPNGTPLVAEAIITSHFISSCTNSNSFQCGITRIVPLESSDLWPGTQRIASFSSTTLTGAQRSAIVAYANSKVGVPYWSYTQTFGPLGGAWTIWQIFFRGVIPVPFSLFLNQMNVNKNLETAFECATFVWRSYYEGTGHALDISNPNNMTAQPGSIFSVMIGAAGDSFLDQIRPFWVLPETFAKSPHLSQSF